MNSATRKLRRHHLHMNLKLRIHPQKTRVSSRTNSHQTIPCAQSITFTPSLSPNCLYPTTSRKTTISHRTEPRTSNLNPTTLFVFVFDQSSRLQKHHHTCIRTHSQHSSHRAQLTQIANTISPPPPPPPTTHHRTNSRPATSTIPTTPFHTRVPAAIRSNERPNPTSSNPPNPTRNPIPHKNRFADVLSTPLADCKTGIMGSVGSVDVAVAVADGGPAVMGTTVEWDLFLWGCERCLRGKKRGGGN